MNNLKGRRVVLRPINDDDYSLVYKWWHLDFEQVYLWWDERRLFTYEEFVEDIHKRLRYFFFTFFIICYFSDNEGEIPVGFTYTSRYNAVDRYLYGTIYLSKEYTSMGLGTEAGLIHLRYLASTFNIRKVYVEIYSYNTPSLKAAKKAGLQEEGRLKAHRWFNNQFWDLIIMAFYLEDLAK